MSLSFRALKLTALTSKGLFGTHIEFTKGLNVIRANNTSGKSTVLNAIVFALGAEQLFGPKREVPLTPAMLTALRDDYGQELSVLKSDVYLEVENASGEIITIHRSASGATDSRLVTVVFGPLITSSRETYKYSDFYTALPGAAQEERGFDLFLSRFMSWELPLVPRFNGSTCPLYLQCILPLLFVEQKRGWSSIQATLPRFLHIREVSERSIEFLLNLDVRGIASSRLELSNRIGQVVRDWDAKASAMRLLARSVNGDATNLDGIPTGTRPQESAPEIILGNLEGKPLPLVRELALKIVDLKRISNEPVLSAGASAESGMEEYQQLLHDVDFFRTRLNVLFREIQDSKSDMAALVKRVEILREDIRHYQDLSRLRSLGSTSDLALINGQCPTCHQKIAESLLSQVEPENLMTIEENLTFLNEERKTLEALSARSSTEVADLERKFDRAQVDLGASQARLRALKSSLVQENDSPSIMDVRNRVELEESISRLRLTASRFEEWFSQLQEIESLYTDLKAELDGLPDSMLSQSDEAKIEMLQRSLIDQEESYRFFSFSPTLLSIDPVTFLPTREGFNLGFDVSATDGVRLIWGYMLGLLEVARTMDTNHPGFMIMDEPQQHKPDQADFSSFLRRASLSKSFGQQVIIATSEEEDEVRKLLHGSEYSLLSSTGWVLTRM